MLFYGGYYQNAGLLRKQLTAAGWKGTLVAGDGVNDPGYIKAAGNAAAAGQHPDLPVRPGHQGGGTFDADYKAAWNQDAGTYSDVAYDAANIFLQGITAGNTTTAQDEHVPRHCRLQGRCQRVQVRRPTASSTPAMIKVWAFKVDNGAVVPDQATPTS